MGCKRILGSEDYYETLAQENVTVIPHALEKIDGQTLYSDGQGYKVDILVLATGFDIQDHFGDLTVIGKDGVNLHDLWQKDSPKTYKTVMISGFPNFFQLLGPGAALGHSSVIEMIEW
jgi:cation diffusion facilitator CzcD-associated flavoprotein CzcO